MDAKEEMFDELEYSITFPSPELQEEAASYQQDGDSKSNPVVVLLGWMGCKDKHLVKYSNFYDKKNCVTIRLVAPTRKIYAQDDYALRPLAIEILDLLISLSLDDQPVLFHAFSNGGGMVYRHISEVLHGLGPNPKQASMDHKRFRGIKVIGVVFDSCPGQRKILIGILALMSSMSGSNVLVRYATGAGMFFWMIFKVVMTFVQKYLLFRSSHYQSYWQSMENERSRWPALYLYSKADSFIDYRYVNKIIAARKAVGVEVSSMCWPSSAHVAHFREHPDAYISQCYSFLDKCLENRKLL